MKLFLKKMHVYLYVLIVALIYFLFWPFFYYFSLKPSRYPYMNRFRRIWAIICPGLVGFYFSFKYEQPIDWSKTYLVCPNHTANLDIPAMCILVKNHCSFMGKEKLKDELVTRLFFNSVDIAVNRDSKMSAYRAFKKAAEKLQQGITLIIFPEGGISDNYPPTLQEFKNGPFRLAIENKIPIIPVSSSNTWKTMWDDGTKYGTKPGICNYYVHKPVETAHLVIDDADKLRDQIFSIISKGLTEGK